MVRSRGGRGSYVPETQRLPATTGIVSTKARAKLKTSARHLLNPARSPTDIVEPDRENPRKGSASPWTAPIRTAVQGFMFAPALDSPGRDPVSPHDDEDAERASPVDMIHRLPKRSSTAAPRTPPRTRRSMRYWSPKPTRPVAIVAMITDFTKLPRSRLLLEEACSSSARSTRGRRTSFRCEASPEGRSTAEKSDRARRAFRR